MLSSTRLEHYKQERTIADVEANFLGVTWLCIDHEATLFLQIMVKKAKAMLVDGVAEETADGSWSKKIADGIAKLKSSDNWPKENIIPGFNSKAGSVYLNILIKGVVSTKKKYHVLFNLPHPLSKKRSICFIGTDVESEEKQSQMTQKFKDEGVLGTIKIVQKSNMETVLTENHESALQELARHHDTFLVDDGSKFLIAKLRDILAEEKKLITTVLDKGESHLCVTALWTNPSNDGYFVKVGHTALTNQQLVENIEKAVSALRSRNIFTNGLCDIKLIQIMTGTTEGVDIYKDDSIPKGPLSIPAPMIVHCIAKLRSAGEWPAEPEERINKDFDSDADSLYLDIFSKDVVTFKKNMFGLLRLPHPLSKNRSLLFIGSDVDSKEKQNQMTEKFREQGVAGNIKIVSLSYMEKILKKKNPPSLQNLAKQYDIHVVDAGCKFLVQKLREVLAEERKFAAVLQDNCNSYLCASAVWANPSNDGLFIKVGHTALTTQQLQKNIAKVVNSLPLLFFPNELGDIKLIQMRAGTNNGIAVYQDDSTLKVSSGLTTKLISKLIEGLKAKSDSWRKDAKFNDDASTVVLNIEPLEVCKGVQGSAFQEIHLPHPLSLDRSVCYISSEEPTKKHKVEITQKLKDAGVIGNIKVISQHLLSKIAQEGGKKTLVELAKTFDTHLTDAGIALSKLVKTEMTRQHKLFTASSSGDLGLNNTVMWLNYRKTAYFVKVGHTGLTDEQLQENVAHVVNFINQKSQLIFPNGLASIKSLRLMTGTSEGVVLCNDDASKEKVKWRLEKKSVTASEVAPETVPKIAPVSVKKKAGKRKLAAPDVTAKKIKAN